jgi:putative endonuclease
MTLADRWNQLTARLSASRPAHLSARGHAAESAACRYLRRQGYRLLGRNLRVAGGELDALAVEDGCLVIVEMRSYAQESGFPPRGALSADKQRRLRRLAEELHKRPLWRDKPVRIDLVEVATDARHRAVGFEIIKGI